MASGDQHPDDKQDGEPAPRQPDAKPRPAEPDKPRNYARILIVSVFGLSILAMVGAPALTFFLSDDIDSLVSEDGLRPIRPLTNN